MIVSTGIIVIGLVIVLYLIAVYKEVKSNNK
jgi:hypothetical protein